jgi:hypothetical protein
VRPVSAMNGLGARVRPRGQVRTHPSPDQPGQTDLLSRAHHRNQPGTRHQIRLVEHRVHCAASMQQSHLRDALSTGVTEA